MSFSKKEAESICAVRHMLQDPCSDCLYRGSYCVDKFVRSQSIEQMLNEREEENDGFKEQAERERAELQRAGQESEGLFE